MHHSVFLRPFASAGRTLSRLVSFVFGSLKFAWTPPPWLIAIGHGFSKHARAVTVLLAISATVGYGAWRATQPRDPHEPIAVLAAATPDPTPPSAATPTPAPAATPAAQPVAPRPTVPADAVDTSKPRIRAVTANLVWRQVGWNEQQKKAVGAALVLQFSGPAAPITLVGKAAAAGTVKIIPEVAGTWKWIDAQQLAFEPQTGWMPPRNYIFQLGEGVFAPDCTVTLKMQYQDSWRAPKLSASFGEESFYVDPSTPTLQQTVATVIFNQPVSREEVVRSLTVVNMSKTPLFAPGGKPQVIADEKNPMRFFLRSPLVKPGEKEDLVRFQITPGVVALSGGEPMEKEAVTKITSPSRYSGFTFKSAKAQLVTGDEDEPRQFVFLETSIAANGATVAKATKAWQLPPPKKDKDGEEEPWTPETVTPAVLAKSTPVPLEFVGGEDAPPVASVFGFRLKPQAPARLFVRVAKETPAPGGFALRENFDEIVDVPRFPREATILGKGGILALNGERKLNIQSRGLQHLRFTLARVPGGQINHLVSQTNGNFESPGFRGRMGFDNIANFHSSVQTLVKKNDHELNYSAFDFAPSLLRIEPGGEDAQRGLFYLSVEGVRRRTPDDAKPSDGDPDPEWISLADANEGERNNNRRNRGEDEEDEGAAGGSGDSRFVLITDFGLIVKRNADGTRDVFVQSFKERVPIAGVRLIALGKNGSTLAEGDTDAQGRVSLPALDGLMREKKPVALIARKGADLAFIPWAREDRAVELSRFETGGVNRSDVSALDAFLFTERGIYRPGDPIQLGAIVRRRDWTGSLAGVPVEVALFNAKEEAAGVFPTKLNADGFIELTLPTSETAPTGVWRIDLRRPDDGKKKKKTDDEDEADARHLGHILVRVEEFQPDRLKLAAKLEPAAKAAWLAPENLTAHAELQTLFGIAAADRRVTAKLRIAPGSPHFDQWPGWSFGLPKHEKFEPREVDLGETKTDAEGRAKFALALDAYAAPLLRVAVDLEAFEADGGRGVRGALGTLVSRQPYLIGWKTADDLAFIPRDTPRAFEIVAIGQDAKAVAAPGLKRVLIETRHTSVLTKQNNDTLAYVSREQDKELETADGSLPASTMKVTLPTNRAGRFRYEWRDAAGVALITVPFTVVGPGEASRNLERDSELEISLPDKVWKPGEQLEVSLRAPYAGAGLITIERERVLSAQWFKADTASSVQHITVPDDIEGGAYVNVAFVRALDSPEIFTSPLSTGVAPFKVTLERRQLTVKLDAPERAKPGERVRIGFSTPRPARIVVWAVDEGIHRVTGYKAPQPLSQLIRKPALEVGTWQLLDLLLPEYSLLKNAKAFGGDGDEPPELKLGLNPFKRRRVAPVVYWSGIIESGPERREVTYDVPDYFAGRLNIIAAAVAPDAVGIAEQHTIVKGPFVLTPNAPFFVAPGDEFNASLTIANQLEGDAVTDQVAVAAEPIGGLDIIESPQSPLTIAVGKEVTVRFRVRVKDALGNAELKFSATAGKERTEQRATMSVRPGVARAAIVQSGWFSKDAHDVPMKRDFFAEFAKREAVVSTTPLGLARGLASYLREYPHGCSEQITSRAFPWLVLREDANFGMDKVEAEKTVRETISLLARRQHTDGGFGYWSSSQNQDGFDYLSVYVTFFLTEAKASGFTVPGPMLDAALRRLRLMADAKITDPWRDERGVLHYERTRGEANIQAAAIYLLTRNEEVTTNYALKMRDYLEKKVPAELWQRDPSAAWLAATWRMLKKEDEAKKLIAIHRKARAGAPRNWDTSWYYETDLTREAMTFTVICRHFPEIAGTFGYDDLKPITDPIAKGDFHTLSAAWSVLALKSYAALVKESGVKAGIAEVTAAGAKVLAAPGAGIVSAKFPTAGGVARFLLTRPDGATKVGAWYQAIETGFDRVLPAAADAHGIEVFREILDEGGDVATMAKTGETLTVRLRVRNVSTTAQPHIAVSELLPGAFDFAPQGEENALKPGLGTLPGAEYVDVREDRALIFCDLAHDETKTFEYSVRPTCAGAFIIPPAYAESMYDRAVNSRGLAGKFTVLPRE
jgi:uncharacterized protein YfaS (alpha-2-macroglobulin family)